MDVQVGEFGHDSIFRLPLPEVEYQPPARPALKKRPPYYVHPPEPPGGAPKCLRSHGGLDTRFAQ